MAEPTTVEEKKNEKVSVVIRRFPHCKVELDASVGPEMIKLAHEQALKDIKKEVSVPGFRKGKAPTEMIVKNYSKSIQDRAKEIIADVAFKAALELAQIPLLNNNAPVQFSSQKLSENEGIFTFIYESEPNVAEIKADNFQLKSIDSTTPGEKELNEAVRQLQLFYAQWHLVTDRPIQEGDFVILDLRTMEDPPQQVFSDTRFEVTDASMAKWMKKMVLGKKAGISIEGISEPDPELPEAKRREFQPKRVLLTIKKVETAEIPPLTEEFAKKVGAKDVEHMKKYLADMLEKKTKEKIDHDKREQVNEFLLSFPMEIPLSLIQKEKEHRRKQYAEDPRYQAKLQAMTDLQRDMEKLELEEALQEQSESAVKLFYASRQIVRDAKINVTYQEVEAEAVRSLKAFGPVGIQSHMIPDELFALTLSKIILAKAQDYILNKNIA